MKKPNKILLYIALAGIASVLFLYCCYIFLLPFVLRNFVPVIQKKIFPDSVMEGFIVKTNPNLDTSIKIKTLKIKEFLEIKDLELEADKLEILNLKTSYVFIDMNKFSKKTSKKSSEKFSIPKLPEVEIKEIELVFKDNKIRIYNLKNEKSNIKFDGNLYALNFKNSISFSANLFYRDNEISTENSRLCFDKHYITLNGGFKGLNDYEILLSGENLPVDDIEKSLLIYQKSQDPAKKFIENFKNYSGFINLNLKITNNGIYGKAEAHDLSAEAVWFDIPLYFREFVLNFNGKNITSNAKGKSGKEEIFHTLFISNLGEENKKTEGVFSANLDDKFNCIPNFKILKKVNASVKYVIFNQKNTIEYTVNLDKNSDLLYKSAYLGLREKNRKFYAKTLKDGNNLYLENFNYSADNKTLVFGNGLFIKKDGKYIPQFINCKTDGNTPVSTAGSFGEYIDGGYFRGDIKYDFVNKLITGNFEVIETEFNNFHVKSAKVTAMKKSAVISAQGTYLEENFKCGLVLDNNFDNGITVEKMDLFLENFKIKRKKSPKRKQINMDDVKKAASKVKKIEMDIKNWKINVKNISMNNIKLEDIVLSGSLKNSVFNFKMNEVLFAKGSLAAKGRYDFTENSSDIDFEAKNIDSNTAADLVFNLKNQIQGCADAKLSAKTARNLENITASLQFKVRDGFLPNLGNMEFMFDKFKKGKITKKYKISDLTNADISKAENLNSDIEGSLILNDGRLSDIQITSSQKYLGLFLDGDYDIRKQDAAIELFGKYNANSPKGVRILFIPLNWILNFVLREDLSIIPYQKQVNKIPAIKQENTKKDNEKEKYFKIDLKGNINTKQVDINIKELK